MKAADDDIFIVYFSFLLIFRIVFANCSKKKKEIRTIHIRPELYRYIALSRSNNNNNILY